ncbi:MAG: hypothetical protein GY758_11925, partial [Fuerstiella sp.]|nr:hypothetical protein [Fuerstiella sp.]
MSTRILVALLVSATSIFAEVRLPKILQSHMVLQRNSDVQLWGQATPGESVSVSGDWLDTVANTFADKEGNWQLQLRTGDAGGPHRVTIQGGNTITLNDVLFGEVWLASGQSNME